MRAACKFINPATSDEYAWPINYDTDNSGGLERDIDVTANTGNVGLVRQQGDVKPMTLSFSGVILTQAQLSAFYVWYGFCSTSTAYFQDVDGTVYEVQITKFDPKKRRGLNRRNGTGTSGLYSWTYDLEMMVYRVVSGPLSFLAPS